MKDERENVRYRIQKEIGLGVAVCALLLSLIEFVYFFILQGYSFFNTLHEPSVIFVFIISLLFLYTYFSQSSNAKRLQVVVIILSGFFSATEARSGNFTSFIIIAIGYFLAFEYGFLEKKFILKTLMIATVYTAFLIYSLTAIQHLTVVIALHSLVGIGMIFFIAFVLFKAQLDKEKARRNELEREVVKRTKELRKTLDEKETLLREVHHRTKNNMQLISSLLNLEYSSVTDERAIEAAQKSMRRIQTLAVAHEYLHNSSNIINIDLHDYVNEFLNLLSADMEVTNVDFTSSIEDGIGANIEAAIPFGIIVNEIINNSLKHAFKEREGGKIVLQTFKQNGEFVLIIEDNGVGIPVDYDVENTESIGLNIILGQIEQLEGRYEVERSNGTRWKISLPMSEEKADGISEKPVFFTLQEK